MGGKQWDVVSSKLYELNPKWMRRADGCREKFCALVFKTPPTGDPTPTLNLQRAHEIKKKMDDKECVGYASQDLDDSLEMSHTLNEDGRRPVTKRMKTKLIAESILQMSVTTEKMGDSVADAIRSLAGTNSGDNETQLQIRTLKHQMSQMDEKIDGISSDMNKFMNAQLALMTSIAKNTQNK